MPRCGRASSRAPSSTRKHRCSPQKVAVARCVRPDRARDRGHCAGDLQALSHLPRRPGVGRVMADTDCTRPGLVDPVRVGLIMTQDSPTVPASPRPTLMPSGPARRRSSRPDRLTEAAARQGHASARLLAGGTRSSSHRARGSTRRRSIPADTPSVVPHCTQRGRSTSRVRATIRVNRSMAGV